MKLLSSGLDCKGVQEWRRVDANGRCEQLILGVSLRPVPQLGNQGKDRESRGPC